MRILLVDDDEDLVDLMRYALGREGYETDAAYDGEQALERVEANRPDLVVLDVNLPRLDGFEVCRRLRRETQVPVILLTARTEERDVVEGLDTGADDYITKPFSARQLAARIRAVLRRSHGPSFRPVSQRVQLGDLVLDRQTHEVTRKGVAVDLTPLEFRMLDVLAMNAGRVVPYTRLIEYVWGYANEDSSKLLKSHLSRVRRKLGLATEGPGAIRSVQGVGYSLTRPADS